MTSTRVGGVVFFILSGVYFFFAGQIPLDFFSQQETFTARSMPQLIGIGGMVCAGLMVVLPSAPTDWRALTSLNWVQPALLMALMWAYAAVFEYLGFGIATLIFLLVAFGILGERRPLRMLLVAIPLVGGFWLLMDGLGIYLSPGTLVEQLMPGEAAS